MIDSQNAALEELTRRIATRKFHSIELYPWQKDVCNGGDAYLQRMLMAANRVGKTFLAAYETVVHATGLYPEWWTGFRIEGRPPGIWTSSLTNETSRDIIQKELLGEVGQEGTGMIPADLLMDVKYRQAGIPDVADTIHVRHATGKECVIKTKVAEQGWQKYQGVQKDFIWQDEEPNDFKVITECFTRLMTVRGRYLITFTPLLGETQLVQHFTNMDDKNAKNRKIFTASWDDAQHLSEEDKQQYLSVYPEHEQQTRAQGIPMMGEGAVFPIADEDILCDPFEIPPHYFRICGVDYGVNHPAAGAWLAHDVDTDTMYLYDEYSKAGELPPYHAAAIKARDRHNFIPVVGPHDGMNEEKSSGERVALQYEAQGVNMLRITARYDDMVGGRQAVEPIVQEIAMRMRDGRFKVFRTCTTFMQEKRGLHRKNNKINAIKDDVMKATFYAAMMIRYAMPANYAAGRNKTGTKRPIFR